MDYFKRVKTFRPGKFFLAITVILTAVLCHAVLCANDLERVPPIRFEQISIEQGLSQSIVTCIVQDNYGFMWFGTEDGLNKYDGYKITVVRHDPDDEKSLSYNHIISLCHDSKGYLWIGTFQKGLNRYNPTTEKFVHYIHDPSDTTSLSNDMVRVIVEDSGGAIWVGTDRGLNLLDRKTRTFKHYFSDPSNPFSISSDKITSICECGTESIWVGTNGDGINRLDKKTGRFTCFKNDPGDGRSLSSNSITSIFSDSAGVIWIGTDGGGLNRYNREDNTFTRFMVEDGPNSISNNSIRAIFEDKKGFLWVGTNGGGVDRLGPKRVKFKNFRNNYNDPTSLSYDEIYAIFQDRTGVIWFGTYGGGINKFDSKRKRFIHYKPEHGERNSLSQEIVWSIYEDESNILWIGTHGGGLNRFDRRKNEFKHYYHDPQDPSSLSNNIVRVVYKGSGEELWVGTNGGGVCRFDRKTEKFKTYRHSPSDPASISHDQIRSIYEDKAGELWIGTNGGGLNRFDKRTGKSVIYKNDPDNPESLSNDFIRFAYEDSDGLFWIGTQGGGLNLMNRDTGVFTRYLSNPDDSTSINSEYVFSIHEDDAGILWFCTWGGGLNKFNKVKGEFTAYTKKDGLSTNSLYGLLEDGNGNFWLSTNNGISRYDSKTGIFKNYNSRDGLQSNEFNGGSFHKSSSGEMFFGGINGFNAFYPEEIEDNPFIPNVVVTSFKKLNREVELSGSLSEMDKLFISYRDFSFSFEFSALEYSAPDKNMYAYRMIGLQDEWIYTDAERRFAYFTTLNPGEYTFQVKASNNDGIWNTEGVSVDIEITPPFWKRASFRIGVLLFVILLVAILYKRRLRNVRLKTELDTAHNAQMHIMPDKSPEVDGFDISGICIPAHEVGGDFFDYIWLDGDKKRLAVVIGDVSGKSMQAAMIAVMSDGMVSTTANFGSSSSSEIAAFLNEAIYRKTPETMFTCLCLSFLDINKREIVFTNAGMKAPILKSGDSVTVLDSMGYGFPLGALAESLYKEESKKLESGDVVFIFSDGVTEARNAAGDFFGDQRLKALLKSINTRELSSLEIQERMLTVLNEFRESSEQDDDITLVVIKAL